ncbi:hypothetical protein B0H34DRAFT_136464 [Crassisporium funariophilum]|nr:hypothetical protein B0H34DRAFT_136464 [Crassisporium funariophilum]
MAVLPFELEREIFKVSAFLYPKCAVRLVLVACRVRDWIEPEIYRILRMSPSTVVPPICKWTFNRAPTRELDVSRLQRIGPHVRHAMLQGCLEEEIVEVLQHCSNVQNVAIWTAPSFGVLAHSVTVALDALPNLRKLAFDLSCFFPDYALPIPFDLPMFKNITHLEIDRRVNPSRWSKISSLQNLSHLLVKYLMGPGLIRTILGSCPTLQKFLYVNYISSGDKERKLLASQDSRFILIEPSSDAINSWEDHVRGGDDEWVAAERRRTSSPSQKAPDFWST